MLNSSFLKKDSCFICHNATNTFICSHCRSRLDFYQNLRGRCSFKNWDLHFTAPYHQGLKRLIWDLKFGRNTGLAKGMAYLMLEGYLKFADRLPDLIGYIPMGNVKEKQRGFNQSRIIAEELAKLMGRKTVDLFKRKDNVSLYKCKKIDRKSLVKDTMSVQRGYGNKSLLIVDDVYTTGATAREAMRALSEKGLGNASFLIFARQEKQENLKNWFS